MQKTIQPLLEWFEQNKRQLPWRQDKDPYHVWVSEIMLQQTRIEAVMGYYARFIGELPNVQALSEVDDDRLLKLWEGLGYYSRARNLKKAALMIQNAYGGHFPQTFAALRKLPGIGDYTAGAIASICFDERVPAVDGNVLRVHARITGSSDNVLLPAVKKSVTAALSAIMPKEAGSFNEALMELGETVCLPAAKRHDRRLAGARQAAKAQERKADGLGAHRAGRQHRHRKARRRSAVGHVSASERGRLSFRKGNKRPLDPLAPQTALCHLSQKRQACFYTYRLADGGLAGRGPACPRRSGRSGSHSTAE